MRRSRTNKTGRFGLVMDPQMRVAIEREAEQRDLPMSCVVRLLLRDHLATLAASSSNQTAAQQ